MPRLVSQFAFPARQLPRVIRAGRYPLEDRDFAYRYCGPTLAVHIYDYVGRIRLGTREFSLAPGDLTLTPPQVPARYDLPRPGHHWCIHLQPARPAGQMLHLPLYLQLGSHFEHAVQRVTEIARYSVPGRRGEIANSPAADVAMQDMLLWLVGLTRPDGAATRKKSDEAVDRVLGIIHARFSESLQIPTLAEEVEITQNHLAHCFRTRLGMTIPHYLLHRRMDHARLLLHTTDIPVQVIARRVGIADPQYFNKQFRRTFGLSPTSWREQSRQGSPVY